MAESVKDECKVCTWVLIAAGLGVAGILAYMAIDLATDGKLSGLLQKAPGLATVTQLRSTDDQAPGDSDAG